jgi:hypothetical protein
MNELAAVKCYSQCVADLLKKLVRSHIATKMALGMIIGRDPDDMAEGDALRNPSGEENPK